jgi:hypothetical protein
MISATQPLTLKVRSIPCEVIKGNFHTLENLSRAQREEALAKFRGPLENHLYLIAEGAQRVVARQRVSTFPLAELIAVGAI